MIELVDITKTYFVDGKKFQGLKGITLTIGRGEFVSIMGPSGSGKSTLSSILGCLASPSSGLYKIAGKIVTDLKSSELADLRNSVIGFVFQDFNLLDGMTVLENVALPLIYAKVNPIERRKRAMNRLEQMGLGHKAKNLPNQLSGGQKQRVAIARALVTNPKLIFADEPTGALDKKTGNDIMGILQDLNRDGQTVVQVTHSPEHGNYGKRIVFIVDGLIVRDELVARPTLAKGIELEHNSIETEFITKLWRVAALAPTADEAATEAMELLINQRNNSMSYMEAARALGSRSGARAEQLLDGLLSSPEAVVRAETVRQIEKSSPEYAIPKWWNAIKDSNGWVRFSAVTMLRKNVKVWGQEEKENITPLLRDSDERVRASVVGVVGEWKDVAYEIPLNDTFSDSDARVRANSLDALRLLGADVGTRSVNTFKLGLDDLNNRVRANAILGLLPFDPEKVVEKLLEMLSDKNNLMRASAAWAVGKIGFVDGVDILLQQLSHEQNELVISQIISSLGISSQQNYSFAEQIKKSLQLSQKNQSINKIAKAA